MLKNRPKNKGARRNSSLLGRRTSAASVESIHRTKRRITESGKRLTNYLSKKGSNFIRKMTLSSKISPIKEEEIESRPKLSFVQGFTDTIEEEESQSEDVVENCDGDSSGDQRKRNTRSSFMSLTNKRNFELHTGSDFQISRLEFRSMVTQLRGIGAVDKEGSREDDLSEKFQNPYVFAHDTYGRVTWDIIIVALLLYITLVTPYRVALDDSASGFMKVFELIIDILFILDLFMQFNTGYIDSNGNTLSSPFSFLFARKLYLVSLTLRKHI